MVMNGVGWFLVPDVGTGDRVDDEAEDVKLHHTSCVSPFAHHNDNLFESTNLQINILEAVTCRPWFCNRKRLPPSPASTEVGLSGHAESWSNRNQFKLSEVYEHENPTKQNER